MQICLLHRDECSQIFKLSLGSHHQNYSHNSLNTNFLVYNRLYSHRYEIIIIWCIPKPQGRGLSVYSTYL